MKVQTLHLLSYLWNFKLLFFYNLSISYNFNIYCYDVVQIGSYFLVHPCCYMWAYLSFYSLYYLFLLFLSITFSVGISLARLICHFYSSPQTNFGLDWLSKYVLISIFGITLIIFKIVLLALLLFPLLSCGNFFPFLLTF